MRKSLFLYIAALLLASLTLGAGCPLIPDIQEKTVELAVGASTTVKFKSEGEINSHYDRRTVDFADSLDLAEILDDAGVDVDSVKSVKLANVFYRVTKQDPTAGRTIEDGNVWIRREGAADSVLLVSSFTETVNSVIDYKVAPLSVEGVSLVNTMLADILLGVQNHVPAPNTGITYTVMGDSEPAGVPTDFEWELKIDLTIVGTVTVEVPS
jgi:hypothetical protein